MAFPFQYYEMSYGLNIEMHKQVTVCWGRSKGVGVCAGVWKLGEGPSTPAVADPGNRGLILKSRGPGGLISAV